MQAVILAAGNSARLGDLTKDRPKCLIEVDGLPLISYSLAYLRAAGISEVVVVTGYRGDVLRSALGAGLPGLPVRYVDNPDYADTGSVISLLAAAREIRSSPFLLLESDLLYHPDFLSVALGDHRDNVILVADPTGSGDEVFICADEGGALSFLGKSAPDDIRADSIGEFAGITRLSRSALRDYCSAAETLRREDEARGHYEDLIYALVEAGKISVHVRHCPGLPWTEVDVPQDLERAKREVLPRIPPAAVETPAA